MVNRVGIFRVSDGSLVRTLEGHTGSGRSVSFSPDGSLIASGSVDDTIKIWNVSDGYLIRTLTGHTDNVNSVTFSPNGSFLASGSADKIIRIWKVSDGSLAGTMVGHTGAVNSVSFSSDGSLLASGGSDGLILWTIAWLQPPPYGIKSLSPNAVTSVAGYPQTFTSIHTDLKGFRNIRFIAFSVGGTALRAAYDVTTNRLFLADDRGSRWIGGYLPGSPFKISNRHGSLDCQNTTVIGSGFNLTVTWTLIPSTRLSGREYPVYLFMENRQGERDGWKAMGRWTIQHIRDVAVRSISVSPSQPRVGQSATINCTVANQGSLVERDLSFRLLINYKPVFSIRISMLNPNEVRQVSANVRFSSPGRYMVRAELSPLPSETDISNNFLSYEIFVTR